MSETRTLTIESVESKGNIFVITASGKKYGCKEDLSQFKGQSGQAEVNSKQNGKFTNWYINKFIPNEDSKSQAQNGSSKEDYFVLRYAADLGVAAITSAQLDPHDPKVVSQYVISLYKLLNEGLKEDEGEIPF